MIRGLNSPGVSILRQELKHCQQQNATRPASARLETCEERPAMLRRPFFEQTIATGLDVQA
jgi:hypothetical protein